MVVVRLVRVAHVDLNRMMIGDFRSSLINPNSLRDNNKIIVLHHVRDDQSLHSRTSTTN